MTPERPARYGDCETAENAGKPLKKSKKIGKKRVAFYERHVIMLSGLFSKKGV